MELTEPVSAIMTPNVVTVTPSQKIIDVKHIFEKKDFHHHIPVTENGRLAGMISLTDYMYAIRGAFISDDEEIYHQLTVKDIMRSNPVSCRSAATINEVAAELAKGEVHAIVVADEGVIRGIVSTADVIRYLLKR